MQNEISASINNPAALEKLYRSDKSVFKEAFGAVYPQLKGNPTAECWHERLFFDTDTPYRVSGREALVVAVLAIIAGIMAKLPAIFSLNEEHFYSRNIGLLVFPFLSAYFAIKHRLPARSVAILVVATLACTIFMNLLPTDDRSDTLVLSCIHVIIVLWSVMGFSFTGSLVNAGEKRLAFLRFNGDLVVISALVLIAGGLLTGMTIGLFSLIGYQVEDFLIENIVVFALPAVPIAGAYLTQNNPQLVGKVSPVIARIFSPLVLVMLVVYIGAMMVSGKDPYNDRDFLLIFNALLVGVMALIFFSVAESSRANTSVAEQWILLLLSAVTIIVNGIALSAIIYRIGAYGITPNRLAVAGSNTLILLHLVLVTIKLFNATRKKGAVADAGHTIAAYLPVYAIWAVIVTFIFPLLFGFR